MATRIQWEKIGSELESINQRYQEAERRFYKASADDDPIEAGKLAWDLRFIQLTANTLAERIEGGL